MSEGEFSMDYKSNEAVLCLNTAIFEDVFGVKNWCLPEGSFLNPPIPNRLNYLMYMKDMIEESMLVEEGVCIRGVDIGVGASCVYPLLGSSYFGWSFVGSDINQPSIQHINSSLLPNNPHLDIKV